MKCCACQSKYFCKHVLLIPLTLVIVVAFFLPWVNVKSVAVSKITSIFSSTEEVSLMSISGYDVPVMANGPDATFMISVIKIFNPSIEGADTKSYLIWAVPLLAIGMLAVSVFYRNKWAKLSLGVVGVVIFAFATYKIMVTDLDKVVMQIDIAYGLWMTLYAYLLFGLVELADFTKQTIKK